MFCGVFRTKTVVQELDFSQKALRELPVDIYQYRSTLQILYLQMNNITDVPKASVVQYHCKHVVCYGHQSVVERVKDGNGTSRWKRNGGVVVVKCILQQSGRVLCPSVCGSSKWLQDRCFWCTKFAPSCKYECHVVC